ncbi:hemolysin [Xylella fastidiosa subsp. morus]|uniref:calcium-binding protein n=2 Tax=Xylella fastidiosa TaxID=2371 RepID=UPI001F3AA28D|nr:calcium-binding protein [Xylella fastidiosa]UIT36681.1 hemolysin [Xylella fastidiosa subsp. morus]UIT38974.1 hemolysin [Xylella fastidiosa subsp. morus]
MNGYESLYNRYMQEANRYATYYGLDPSTAHNGEWDAFRHAYASGAMTREYGETAAHLFGDLNEIRGDFIHNQPEYEKNMDKWNNSVGRNIGKDSTSSDEIARRVYDAMKRGHLITDPWNDTRRYNERNQPGKGNNRDALGDSAGSNSHGTGAAGGPGVGGASVSKRITPLPPRDPLALDLDGDGIETTGSDGRVILFDHDADGVKTGTGWLKPDDGWLVLDRNGNGTIDSGRELFGTDTVKRNGQLATDGFDALRDVDSNQDGKIDAADRVFANLRIWRDLNQDGISQANELSTLDANHIVSIGVTATAGRVDLGNGNVQTAAGAFTRSNSTTGATEGTTGTAANLDLLADTFYRDFTQQVALTDQAKALPFLRGSGRVRNLDEAISLSKDLGDWVQSYSQQSTRQAQLDRLDGLMEKWANTSDMQSLRAQAEALASKGVTVTYVLSGLNPGTAAYQNFLRKLDIVERFMGFTYGGKQGEARFTPLDATSGTMTVSLSDAQVTNIALAYERFKTDIYESLLLKTRMEPIYNLAEEDFVNGAWVMDWSGVERALKQGIQRHPRDGILDAIEFVSALGYKTAERLGWNAIGFLADQLSATPDLGAFDHESSSWTVIFAAADQHFIPGSARSNVLLGTPGDDSIRGGNGEGDDVLIGKGGNDALSGGDGADTLDGGSGNDMLYGGTGNDTYQFAIGAGVDRIEENDSTPGNTDVVRFADVASTALIALERKDGDLVIKYGASDQLTVSNYFDDIYSGYKVEQFTFSDGVTWDEAAIKARVITNGDASNNYLRGYNNGSNRIYGLDGNDEIYGGALDDMLYGGAGNDMLSGGGGADTLDGGSGNDTLNGGTGNDTYRFAIGVGVDRIEDSDSTPGNTDVVRFADVASTALTALERKDNDLVIKYGTGDQLTVIEYFNPNYSGYKIEQFTFSDGVTWDDGVIKARVISKGDANDNYLRGYNDGSNRIYGLDGNDTIYGGALADILDGGHGHDTLIGNAGDDTLFGGTGNDVLSGGDGADTLDGGSGNDVLYGGTGNDTYRFAIGAGVDRIEESDTTAGNTDVVRFADVASTALIALERKDGDLVIKYGASDQLTVSNYFDDIYSGYKVEQFTFSDGVTWDEAAIKARVITNGDASNNYLRGYNNGSNRIYGLDGNDEIYGGALDDMLYGGAGNDMLSGGKGADTLDGGSGNDVLYGGTGNDMYRFAIGAGVDRIEESDTTAGNTDVVRFADVASTALIALERKDGDLVIKYGASDQLTVSNYFDDIYSGYKVEQFTFSDGVTWDEAAIKARVITNGDASNNYLRGYNNGSNRIYGLDGNDEIYGGALDDMLYGGAGNDMLSGGKGADTLDGGSGNDVLYGGTGNDMYRFAIGAGVDRIEESDTTAGNTDVVRFADVASTALTALERKDSDLVIKYGTSDQLTISNYFYSAEYKVEQFTFSDGVTWDEAAIKARVITNGDASNNYLRGYNDGSNRIYGLDGNDEIYGGALDDMLYGGAGNDMLSGGKGADTLDGGSGNDVLYGGTGNDMYRFAIGAGVDRIEDYDTTTGNADVLSIGQGVSINQLWFQHVGNDLEVSIIGTGDQITIRDWYSNAAYHVEQFKTSDGKVLRDSQVNALVSAMAGFAPPVLGQTSLSTDYQKALNPLIAAHWK